MPRGLLLRDVMTRWNLTFNMLNFAYEHWNTINLMMQDHANGLRDFKLSEDEWDIVRQLRDVFKVCHFVSSLT